MSWTQSSMEFIYENTMIARLKVGSLKTVHLFQLLVLFTMICTLFYIADITNQLHHDESWAAKGHYRRYVSYLDENMVQAGVGPLPKRSIDDIVKTEFKVMMPLKSRAEHRREVEQLKKDLGIKSAIDIRPEMLMKLIQERYIFQ